MSEFAVGKWLTKFHGCNTAFDAKAVQWFDDYWKHREAELGMRLEWYPPRRGRNKKVWRSEAQIVGMNDNG